MKITAAIAQMKSARIVFLLTIMSPPLGMLFLTYV